MKPIQVFYQLVYRIKSRFIHLKNYQKYGGCKVDNVAFSVYERLVPGYGKCTGRYSFLFLGIAHDFKDKVDWNFSEPGKLWNYNLQYFDYLNDSSISIEIRKDLLREFSEQLLSGEVATEPYPVSLRIMNTIYFLSKNEIKDEVIEVCLKNQIDYLVNNLEYHILGNHLLENLFSLHVASFYLRDIYLFGKSYKLLQDQLNEQILEDGGHYECSPMYHSIILSKLLICLDVYLHNPRIGNTENELNFIRRKASLMLGWINQFSFPDGSWAMMNDGVLGIAPTTRLLNETASELNIFANEIHLTQSGYRKLKGNNWELLADFGNIIPSYQPGHAHADMLSFCLWHKGKQVVVDPGISTYNNTEQRRKERSTAVHNTVTINKENQSDVWSSFRVGKRAKLQMLEENDNIIAGIHDGYKSFGILHKRTFLKSGNDLIIRDYIEGNNDGLKIQASILFDESVKFDCFGNKLISKEFEMVSTHKFQKEQARYSIAYNSVKNTYAAIYYISVSSEVIVRFK